MLALDSVTLLKSCVIGLLCWALWSDTKTYTIPNRISLGLLALYPAWILATWPQTNILGGLLAGGTLLVVGFVLFATRVLGGGDAKLMAAVGLWVGPQFVLPFVTLTTIVGGGLALTVFLYVCVRDEAWKQVSWASVKVIGAQPVPYGIAIALGAIATILSLPG